MRSKVLNPAGAVDAAGGGAPNEAGIGPDPIRGLGPEAATGLITGPELMGPGAPSKSIVLKPLGPISVIW